MGEEYALDMDPHPATRRWASSRGTYLAGRSYVDEADHTAAQMEAKWGCDRLRRLVGPELREKFDRQRYLFNRAVWHGQDLEQVKRESMRMVKAWLALDAAATKSGAKQLDPLVWEVPLRDGSVAALVPDNDHANRVVAEGRAVNVYTLEEIARLLDGYPALAKIKDAWAGATITAVRRNVPDPLDAFCDSRASLEDEIPF